MDPDTVERSEQDLGEFADSDVDGYETRVQGEDRDDDPIILSAGALVDSKGTMCVVAEETNRIILGRRGETVPQDALAELVSRSGDAHFVTEGEIAERPDRRATSVSHAIDVAWLDDGGISSG